MIRSTALSSPLPWTPKPRRQIPTDVAATNSRRLGWTENTNLNLRWSPPAWHGVALGLEVRNLFDNRSYRTGTGQGSGAYWSQIGADPGHWVPVHDPRLSNPPRAARMSIGARW